MINPNTTQGKGERQKYKTIVVDPPWRIKAGPRSLHNKGQVSRPLVYPTMSLERICELPVWKYADENSCCFLWTINHYIEQSYSVMRAWGFTPSTMLVWCKKPKGRGLGGKFGISTEYLLYGTKGKQSAKHYPSTWFEAKRGKHSQKPNMSLEIIEKVTDEPRIELFSRVRREGWDVWGNEVNSDIEFL